MMRNMMIMLACLGVLLGGIFGYHAFMAHLTQQFIASMGQPPVTVSSTKVAYENWQPEIKAVGSLRAIKGVDLSAEMSGVVKEILFKSADEVTEGQVLFKINDDIEQAQLRSLNVDATLASTMLERDKKQFEVQAVSQATIDADQASLESKQAMITQQQALIDKKVVKATFAGKLGISMINVGQYINMGDKIVTLQNLDQMFVDFYVPQQEISRIIVGQQLKVTSDSYPSIVFEGKISAINPKVDMDSRNVQVEAIIDNPKHQLLPGMFVTIDIQAGQSVKYLTLPQSAVSFNPYGETIYIVEENGKDKEGKPQLSVKQGFITTGDTRGDQVAVLSGIKEGQEIVTVGGHKLRNGSVVIINNDVKPLNDPSPKIIDQ